MKLPAGGEFGRHQCKGSSLRSAVSEESSKNEPSFSDTIWDISF